jgi:hypothetical protein
MNMHKNFIGSIHFHPIGRNACAQPPSAELMSHREVKLSVGWPKNGAPVGGPERGRKPVPSGALRDAGAEEWNFNPDPSGSDDLEQEKPSSERHSINLKSRLDVGGTWVIDSPEQAVAAFFKGSEPQLHRTRDSKKLPKRISCVRGKERLAST